MFIQTTFAATEKGERTMTCKDCIYEPQCILRISYGMGDNDDKPLTDMEKRCKPFKNKADYAEVKHGEWIKDNKIKSPIYFNCSLCGNTTDKDSHGNYIGITPYCSMCGAEMDGGNLSAIPTGLDRRG